MPRRSPKVSRTSCGHRLLRLSRLRAAFSSRSMTRPHAWHRYVRSDRDSLAFTVPQPEHVLELGQNRPAVMSWPPFRVVLQASIRRASPKPASEMARASRRFRVIPATFRSSETTVAYRAARPVVALCRASARTLATRAWMRASRAADLRRFALPFAVRECARLARRGWRSEDRSASGPSTVTTRPRSSTPVSRVLIPRSTPIADPGRECRSGMARSASTVNDTCQRCAVRVTVAGKIRAVPLSSLRASLRVDSCVRSVPSLGRVTVRPAHRITPAPNRNESRHLPRFLNLGKPSPRPLRSPFRDLVKSRSALSRSRNASW